MKIKFMALIALAVAIAPFAANAATITQQDTFSGTLDFDHISTFNQFDTMGGTRVLNSVTLAIEFSIDSGSFIADNDAATPAAVTFEYDVDADLTSSDVFISSAVGVGISDSVSLNLSADNGDGTGVIDGTGPDGTNVAPSTALFSDSEVMSALAQTTFIGTGTFDTLFESSRSFSITGSSGVEGGYTNMTGAGKVSVVYDYTVVPEPATLAILGLGGLFIRRRKK